METVSNTDYCLRAYCRSCCEFNPAHYTATHDLGLQLLVLHAELVLLRRRKADATATGATATTIDDCMRSQPMGTSSRMQLVLSSLDVLVHGHGLSGHTTAPPGSPVDMWISV